MPTLTFPETPDFDAGSSPRAWLPAPDEIVDACREAIADGEPDKFDELTPGFGAPPVDLATTPLTARATLLAARHGRTFFHHELRRRLQMPEGLEPEVEVWEGSTVPAWSDGVLAEPKYFSFRQEAPIPAYNPNHRRKWRAHELLHGVSRFFWHPRMTRFEFYVSARLNELLPVVHWYNLDEVFRPRCDRHEDTVLHRDHCLECQQAAVAYWESTAPERDERIEAANRLVDRGWSHFEEEWEAIGTEIETGRRVETPRPRLDASSDAVGYMRAHWNRATAWSFGRWIEMFMEDGVDYFSGLSRLRNHVGRSLQRLVGGEVSVTTEEYVARRTRSQLQDLGYRVLLALEHLEPNSADARRAESKLMPALERSAGLVAQLLEDPSLIEEGLDQFARTCQLFSEVESRFPDEIADSFLAFGYRFVDPQAFGDAAVGQVYSGLEDGMPATVDRLEEPVESIRGFVLSETFDRRGRLAGRFAEWLAGVGDEDDEEGREGPSARLVETARFEAFVNGEPRRDREATNFAALPGRAEELLERDGVLRPHATLRRERFDAEVVAGVVGQSIEETGEIGVAASLVDGDLRLVVEDEAIAAVLDAVVDQRPLDEWWEPGVAEAVMTLLGHSLITWLPAPRGG